MEVVNKVGSAFLSAILLRMKELGLNKSSLARKMNVSRAYVCQVFQGKDLNFSFATAIRFAKAVQMDFTPQLTIAPEDASNDELQASNSKLQTTPLATV